MIHPNRQMFVLRRQHHDGITEYVEGDDGRTADLDLAMKFHSAIGALEWAQRWWALSAWEERPPRVWEAVPVTKDPKRALRARDFDLECVLARESEEGIVYFMETGPYIGGRWTDDLEKAKVLLLSEVTAGVSFFETAHVVPVEAVDLGWRELEPPQGGDDAVQEDQGGLEGCRAPVGDHEQTG